MNTIITTKCCRASFGRFIDGTLTEMKVKLFSGSLILAEEQGKLFISFVEVDPLRKAAAVAIESSDMLPEVAAIGGQAAIALAKGYLGMRGSGWHPSGRRLKITQSLNSKMENHRKENWNEERYGFVNVRFKCILTKDSFVNWKRGNGIINVVGSSFICFQNYMTLEAEKEFDYPVCWFNLDTNNSAGLWVSQIQKYLPVNRISSLYADCHRNGPAGP